MSETFLLYSHPAYRWLVFGFSILAGTLAWTTCASDCCSRFAIQEEVIYFQPLFDNSFIPNPNVNGPFPFTVGAPGARKKNKFDYASGYRFAAFYFPNCKSWVQEVSLRFTYLPAQHSRKMTSHSSLFIGSESSTTVDAVHDLIDILNVLAADHQLDYYAGDLSIHCPIANQCAFSFSVQPGLHYALMNYENRVHFTAKHDAIFRRASLKERSQTWGIGPQLGFKLNYRLGNRLSIKGLVNGGLLIARSTVHFRAHATSSTISFPTFHEQNDPLWRVLPFWEGCAALHFSFCVNGYVVGIEAGYEYLSYPDFISRIRSHHEDLPTVVNDLYSNVAFQGPYVALTLGF